MPTPPPAHAPGLRALRILLVHERFPPDYGGGGEYVVLQTAKHLIARGHRLQVLTTGDPRQDQFEGVPVTRLPMSRYRFNLAWREVAARARSVDLIHAFSNHAAHPAARAGQVAGRPAVLGVLALFGAVWRDTRGPVVGRLFQAFERHLLRLPVGRRVFLSAESLLLAQDQGLARADDVVLAPGISLEDYGPAEHKDGVMFSGKLDARKGTETVLRLAREMPDVPFLALVWGDDFDRFKQASPPNMEVRRFESRQQLATALGEARIFLFPSKAETFGLVVAEAMASGCAVVGAAPINFEGRRIDPEDPVACRAALQALWDDPRACHRAGRANVELAQVYSWARHIDTLEATYEALLREHAAQTGRTRPPLARTAA